MLIKKNYIIFILVIIFGIGIYTGNSLYKYYTHCIQINYAKDSFYGKFASELKKSMQKKGYNFSCPIFVPKIIIDFIYTKKKISERRVKKRYGNIKIAMVGDCYDAFNVELLRTYDYLLTVYEYHLGYHAMFNFRAIHFPINYIPFNKMCGTKYEVQKIDIEDVTKQLDDIIQRVR